MRISFQAPPPPTTGPCVDGGGLSKTCAFDSSAPETLLNSPAGRQTGAILKRAGGLIISRRFFPLEFDSLRLYRPPGDEQQLPSRQLCLLYGLEEL